MARYQPGELVWIWTAPDKLSIGTVIDGGLSTQEGLWTYSILADGIIHSRHDYRVWTSRSEAEKHPPVTLPSTRRIYPSLIASHMIEVQPMTLPKGLLFYLDHAYASGSKEEE